MVLGRSCAWAMLAVCAVVALSPQPARADNWPNWRGPALDGAAAGRGYVSTWSPTDHVLWRVKLPGLGANHLPST